MLKDDDRWLHNQAISTLTHLLLIHTISAYNKNREAGGNIINSCFTDANINNKLIFYWYKY
jgi:hypothetical protein